jgi:hypothetical protein
MPLFGLKQAEIASRELVVAAMRAFRIRHR